MRLRFLTNLTDGPAFRLLGETQEEADADKRAYLADKIKGKPMATRRYSVEKLEAMGVYGVYIEGGDDAPR